MSNWLIFFLLSSLPVLVLDFVLPLFLSFFSIFLFDTLFVILSNSWEFFFFYLSLLGVLVLVLPPIFSSIECFLLIELMITALELLRLVTGVFICILFIYAALFTLVLSTCFESASANISFSTSTNLTSKFWIKFICCSYGTDNGWDAIASGLLLILVCSLSLSFFRSFLLL